MDQNKRSDHKSTEKFAPKRDRKPYEPARILFRGAMEAHAVGSCNQTGVGVARRCHQGARPLSRSGSADLVCTRRNIHVATI